MNKNPYALHALHKKQLDVLGMICRCESIISTLKKSIEPGIISPTSASYLMYLFQIPGLKKDLIKYKAIKDRLWKYYDNL